MEIKQWLMIVYGSYLITFRSIRSEKFPELKLPAGTLIHQQMELGHLYWLPFVPYEKYWMVILRGEMHKLHESSVKLVEAKEGTVKTPLYSYSGYVVLAIGLGVLYYFLFLR